MKKLIFLFVVLMTTSIHAQNLMNVAFDTNGPMGECLFPQNADGENVTIVMKKVYMAPELVEVEIQKINLLTSSPGVTGTGIDNPPSWGGNGDGVVPEIPEILGSPVNLCVYP